MATQKLSGVILHSMNWSENSRIIRLLTFTSGKWPLIVRGANKPNSPFAGKIDPLQVIECVVDVKPGRDLNYLKEADLIHDHFRLSKDPRRYYRALFMAEWIDRFIDEMETDDQLATVFANFLSQLYTIKHPESFLVKFLIWFCHYAGYDITFARLRPGIHWFDLKNGSFAIARPESAHHIQLSPDFYPYLYKIVAQPRDLLDEVDTPPEAEKEAVRMIRNYLNFHLDTSVSLKTESYL